MRVLLTRPQKDSEQLAQELAKHGHTSIIEPLLMIERTDDTMPDLQNLQAVMLTSAHALDFLSPAHLDRLLRLPCFCVGTRTAIAAEKFGFAEVVDVAGDGLILAEAIRSLLEPENGAILYAAALDRDDRASETLQEKGFEIRLWITYRADVAVTFSPSIIAAWKNGQIDAALLFSGRTAATLKNLLEKHGLQACCKQVLAIGISDMVLKAADGLPWRQMLAAETPTEASLLHLLHNLSTEVP